MTAAIAIAIHALTAVIWIGGMFFAYMVLRPAAGALEPSQRLQLWDGCFERFFKWVWVAIVVLPASGYWIIFGVWGGLQGAGMHVHAMQTIGIVMILIFLYLYFAPYRRFRDAVAASDWPTAGTHLNRIRQLEGTNLILGLIIVVAGVTGRYWN